MELADSSTSSVGVEESKNLRQVMNSLVPSPLPKSSAIGASAGHGHRDTSAVAVPTLSLFAPDDGMNLPSSFVDQSKFQSLPEGASMDGISSSVLLAPVPNVSREVMEEFHPGAIVESLHWLGTGSSQMDRAGTLGFGAPMELMTLGGSAFFVGDTLRSFSSDRPVVTYTGKSGPVLIPWQASGFEVKTSLWRHFIDAHWDLPGAVLDLENRLNWGAKTYSDQPSRTWQVMPSSKVAPIMTELPKLPSVIDLPVSTMPRAKP
jgi:hypothetical protein